MQEKWTSHRHPPGWQTHTPFRRTSRSLWLYRRLSLLLSLALLVWALPGRATEHTPAVFLTFYDVGHGDALLLHQPGRCAILVDAGPPDTSRKIGTSLTKKGIYRLDRLIISHPHRDHFGGVLTLPTELTIGQVNDNGLVNEQEKDFFAYRNWRKQHHYRPQQQGDVWQCGDLAFTVLSPGANIGKAPIINDTSLVLRVEAGPVSLLLPGDIQAAGRQSLLGRPPELNVDILKVPYHGRQDGQIRKWLAAVSPELSVISAGSRNTLSTPDNETLTILRQINSDIWLTDQQGDLEISIDQQGWHYVRP